MLKGLGDLGNLMKLQKEFKNIQKKITGATREGRAPTAQGEGGGERRVPGHGRFRSIPEYLKSAVAARTGKIGRRPRSTTRSMG